MEAALAALDEAEGQLEQRGQRSLRCNVLITFAVTDFLTSGRDAALVRLSEAERLARSLRDESLLARVLYQRANIHGRVGDLVSAWADMQRAISRPEAFSAREQSSVHISRGMLAFLLAKPHDALSAFDEARQIAHDHEFPQQEHMALHNFGYATYLLGDIPRSLAIMAAADEIPADVSRAMEQLDRARVLLEAGLVTEAVEVLDAGATDDELSDNDQLRAEFDLELARAHRLLGQLDLAAAASSAAGAAYRRLGAEAWEVKATLIGLVVELDRLRRVRSGPAEGWVREEIEVARLAGGTADELASRSVELGDYDLAEQAKVVAGDALLLAGDVEAARRRLLVPRRSAPGSLADELNAASVTASMHVAANERTAARRLLGSAVKRLAAGQQGSASLDLRTARALHGVRLAAIDLELAVPRGSAAILETLERWRSATDRLPSLARPSDERLAGLTESLRSVRARQRNEADANVVRELQRKASRLEQQIRGRDWALSSSSEAAAAVPVRVKEARAALARADRDLVWLFPHRGRLCGVGVNGDRASSRDLMDLREASELARQVRLDLRAAATQQLGPLHSAVWRSLETSVARLDDAVIRPWRAHRQGLVLVTSPQVSALPWALFPSLVGRPLTLAWTLTSFARRDPGGARPKGERLSRTHISVGPGLARASAEAQAVAEAWRAIGAEVTLDDPSVGADLVGALSDATVVHVAAHGTHQVQSPLFSSLSLHDGPVFAHELQPTGVTAEHVVLSACDVGSANFRPGEEQLGMAASMISLGARSVVAAIAPVPDEVAEATMIAHHDALARGSASDEALALAIAATDPLSAAFLNLGSRFVR